ncbi:MAG TPA: CPBP family glutamic-type intramembrane protease [Terriglobia bacterium]|nr:CPBP family glutamic-type intramembrane protease [Terriglobia bacterium]
MLTGLEIAAVFAGVLLDIWSWQYAHPRLWMALLAAVILSHLVHRDTLHSVGLAPAELRASAELVLPIMLLFYIPLVLFGFATGRLGLIFPGPRSGLYFVSYAGWCCFQQYVTQGYFHNRLLGVFRSPHVSSALVALLFAAVHLPSPILTAATAVAGFIFSEVFARHRNIWPLALAQTVGGFLVAVLAPPALIHNMRVGPGYFFWSLR